MNRHDEVGQFSIHPDTLAARPLPCIGGRCDGQAMRVKSGDVLILAFDTIAGWRAVSLPPHMVEVAQQVGTYAGHYERVGDELHWRLADTLPHADVSL